MIVLILKLKINHVKRILFLRSSFELQSFFLKLQYFAKQDGSPTECSLGTRPIGSWTQIYVGLKIISFDSLFNPATIEGVLKPIFHS